MFKVPLGRSQQKQKKMMLASLILTFLASYLIAGSPIYPICYLENTNNQYFLAGPVVYALAAVACMPLGDHAKLWAQGHSNDAMQTFLDVRRGMRACNNTVKAWVYDRALIPPTKAGEAVDTPIIPPPTRILTPRGMIDTNDDDLIKEYWVLCEVLPQ